MSAAASTGQQPYYFIPQPSRFPAQTALGFLFIILGASQWINGHEWGMYSFILGLAIWLFTLQAWFRAAIAESEGGLYSDRPDRRAGQSPADSRQRWRRCTDRRGKSPQDRQRQSPTAASVAGLSR